MKLKKFASLLLALVMMLALATPAYAAKPVKGSAAASGQKTVVLKGDQTGEEFEYSKECWSTWENVIFLGGANKDSTDDDVSAWHLVYTDKKGINNDLKEMHLEFANGEKYDWSWNVGLSTNGSGNNPGWMVVAPGDWGKIVVAKSYIVTTSSKNVQFNISGYYEAGSYPKTDPEPEPTPVNATINIKKLIQSGDKQVTPTYESFTFQILDAEGNTVGTITTDKQTGLGSTTVQNVVPGTYTIHELITDNRFTAEDMTVEITDQENATYEIAFVNTPEEGTTSSVFEITKYVNDFGTPGEGFTFGIYAEDDIKIAEMTSDENGYASTEDFWVAPGTYTIKEINQDTDTYEVNNEVVTATVDEYGDVSYSLDDNGMEQNFFTNYVYGSLKVDTPAVMEKYDELWHTPEYQSVEAQGTMVSIPVNMTDKNHKNLPAGITALVQSGPRDGFTYVQINKIDLSANKDGATIGIVKKDGNMSDDIMADLTIPTLNPVNPWEKARLATYTLKLSEDGKTLYFESTMPDFRLTFSDTEHTPVHQGGHEGESIQADKDGIYRNEYDVANWGENFRVMVHYANKGYNTDTVISCNPDTTITRECERVYEGDVTVTVTNVAGETVDNLDKLPHGEYTVIVTANGETLSTQTVTVNPGVETHVTFTNPLYLIEKGESVYKCANLNCALNLPTVEHY